MEIFQIVLGILHICRIHDFLQIIRHPLLHQRISDLQNPLGIILPDIINHISKPVALGRNHSSVACLALFLYPAGQLRRHIGLQRRLHQTSLQRSNLGIIIFVAKFRKTLFRGRAVLPLVQNSLSIVFGCNRHADIRRGRLAQITFFKTRHKIPVIGGILDYSCISGLPLLVKQPVAYQGIHRRASHVLVQIVVRTHGFFLLIRLFLCKFHCSGNLRLGGLIFGLRFISRSLISGSLLILCLFYRICQLCGLCGQLSVYDFHIVVHGIIAGFVFLIICLDLLLAGRKPFSQCLGIGAGQQPLLHIRLYPGLCGIGAVQFLHIRFRRASCF